MRWRRCHHLRNGNTLIWKIGVATWDSPEDKPSIDSRSVVSGKEHYIREENTF